MGFRRALVKASTTAWLKRQINARELGLLLAGTLRFSAELEAKAIEVGQAMGRIPPEAGPGEIDWEALLELLMELLPVLIELLMLLF